MAVPVDQYYLVSVQENETVLHFLLKILRPGYDNHRGDHEDFVYKLVNEKLELIKKVCGEKYRKDEQAKLTIQVIGMFEDWDESLEQYEHSFEEIPIQIQYTGKNYLYPGININININQVDDEAEGPIQSYQAIFVSEKQIDLSAIKHYNLWRINTHTDSDYW